MSTVPATDDAATDPSGQAPFCGRCGRPEADPGHQDCRRALALEPPRYCRDCRRRMVVQVNPVGWTARCSAHGVLTS